MKFSNIFNRQFLIFLATGGVNTLFGYGIFACLIFFKIDYKISILCATIVGVIFNFFSMSRVVFNSRQNNLIFKFVLVYCVLYGFNISIMKALGLIENNLYLNGIIAIALSALIGFFTNKHFVFKESA